RDVMLEARLAQRAGRELRVEGHRADDLVDGDVLVPGLAREETGSAHGVGFPKPTAARPDVSKTWWAREDSNLQPDRYERSALTIELRARCVRARPAPPAPHTMPPRERQSRRGPRG